MVLCLSGSQIFVCTNGILCFTMNYHERKKKKKALMLPATSNLNFLGVMASLLYVRLWKKEIETNYSGSPGQSVFLNSLFLLHFIVDLLILEFKVILYYCWWTAGLSAVQQDYKIGAVNATVSRILFYALSWISLFSMNIYILLMIIF